jgi:hypothetical protein
MAINLSTAFVTLFDAEVKQAYQGQSMLRGAVRLRSGVEGSTYKFPKIGKGVAQVRVPQTDVTPLNVTYGQVTVTLGDFIAAEYADIFMQAKVNFDERRELVQVVSKAIGRRQDQIILDALNASSTSLTVSNDIGGTDTNMNVAKLRDAKKASSMQAMCLLVIVTSSSTPQLGCRCFPKLRLRAATSIRLRPWFLVRSILSSGSPSMCLVTVMRVACLYLRPVLRLRSTRMLSVWQRVLLLRVKSTTSLRRLLS